MKITNIEAIILRLPASERTEVLVGHEDDLIVRIETDEGIEGIGEIEGPPLVNYGIVKSIHPGTWNVGLEEALLAQNPLDVRGLWERMYRLGTGLGRRGLVMYALSGLDIALWDIAGKYYDQPIYEMLGRGRDPDGVVTPYASLWPNEPSVEALVRRLRRDVKGPGYKGAKFWISSFLDPKAPNEKMAVRYVEAARKELGDDTAIMADASNQMETKQAIRLAKMLEPHDLYFLEAALSPDNYEGYAKLSASTTIKIAAGEEQSSGHMLIELMDRGKVDVIQPDAILCGGITECKRVAELAVDREILCTPHASNADIGMMANMHVAASIPNAPFCERFIARSPMTRDLVNERFELDSKGRLKLPRKPGLGVTLNKKTLEKYRYDGPMGHY